MSLMLRLTRNELEKIARQWRPVIALILVALVAVFACVIGVETLPPGTHAASVAFAFLTTIAGGLMSLVICLVAGDVISGELSGGTIKLLLTRPVSRWKIWLSKYFAATLAVWAILLFLFIVIYVALGLKVGFGHWSDPPPRLSQALYHTAWAETWRVLLIEAYAEMVLVALVLLVSSFTNTAVAGIGVSFGIIVVGSIIANNAVDRTWAHYLIFPHLQAASHLTGGFSIPHSTLAFSIAVLGAWLLGSVALGMWRFQSRDILA